MINLTDQMIYRLGNLNTEQTRISYQMSTGKRLENGSDDSSVFARELYVNDKIRTYEGLQVQIDQSQAQNTVADTSINEIKNLLASIKTEIIKARTAGPDAADKQAMAVVIEGMKENMATLVNGRINGEYLFSGSDSTVRPFVTDAVTGKVSYAGDSSVKTIQVEPNTYRDKGVNGFDVMYYDKDTGTSADALNFTLNERTLDENNVEWHLNEAIEDYKLSFHVDDLIQDKTVPGAAVGETWVLSEAKVGHALTFDRDDSTGGTIVDNNGVAWQLNGAETQLEKVGGSGAGDDIITVTNSGGDIFVTDPILGSKGIEKLSTGDLRLREIVANNMPGAAANELAVTNIEGNQYQTTNVTAAIQSLVANEAGGLNLRHFDSFGEVVTADTKTDITLNLAGTDADTGMTIREYTLGTGVGGIATNELFKAKHSIFDDIDTIINALNTDTPVTIDTINGPIGLESTLELISKAFDATNVSHSKLGGRNKIFELASATVSAKITHFNILSQQVGSIDLGKVAMEAKALEMTYTALYSTISKMNTLSLVNFMR